MIIPLFVLLLMIAQATGIDSGAYTMSNITSQEVGYNAEPKRWVLPVLVILCVPGNYVIDTCRWYGGSKNLIHPDLYTYFGPSDLFYYFSITLVKRGFWSTENTCQ